MIYQNPAKECDYANDSPSPLAVWIQGHDSKSASPQKHDERRHPHDDPMLRSASANDNVKPRHDPAHENPQSNQNEHSTRHKEKPRRNPKSLIEASGVARASKRAHHEIGDKFCQIDNDEPVKCVKQWPALCRLGTCKKVQANNHEDRMHEKRDAADHRFRRVAAGRKQSIIGNPFVPPFIVTGLPPNHGKRARYVAEKPSCDAVRILMDHDDDCLEG